MSCAFLTHGQLVELTHYRQHTKQAVACRQMGVPFRVRPDGSVAVAAALFDKGTEYRATIGSEPKLRLQGAGRHGTSARSK